MRQSFTDFTRKDLGRAVSARSSNYNTDFVADTDVVREREDFMRETIREYSMNGSMIIGIDNGYGNTKTARTCFKTAIMKCDSKPVLSRNFIEYEGAYYVIGEGHKGFVSDKQQDEDFGKEPHRLSALRTAPFEGIRLSGGYFICTLDGIKIDTNMNAIDKDGNPIEGLYVAGDCSGSYFDGSYPNLLAGCAAGRSVTFGRLAGRNAAHRA